MSDWNDGKIVELVKKYSFIYDRTSFLFKNKVARKNAWKEIGAEIGETGELCEQRWNVLRTRYNTERRLLMKPSESTAGGGNKKKWYLFESFGFLDAHLIRKKTKGNYLSCHVKNENEEEISTSEQKMSASFEYVNVNVTETDESQNSMETPSTSSMSELINENKGQKRKTINDEDVNLNSVFQGVQTYLNNKSNKHKEIEDSDMCFGKQVYFQLKDIKNKKKKTELKIKILNLFLDVEDD